MSDHRFIHTNTSKEILLGILCEKKDIELIKKLIKEENNEEVLNEYFSIVCCYDLAEIVKEMLGNKAVDPTYNSM